MICPKIGGGGPGNTDAFGHLDSIICTILPTLVFQFQTGETSPTSPHPAQYSPSQCELSSVERTEMRKLRRRLRGDGEGGGGESIWFEIRQGGGGDSFLLLSLCSLKIK